MTVGGMKELLKKYDDNRDIVIVLSEQPGMEPLDVPMNYTRLAGHQDLVPYLALSIPGFFGG